MTGRRNGFLYRRVLVFTRGFIMVLPARSVYSLSPVGLALHRFSVAFVELRAHAQGVVVVGIVVTVSSVVGVAQNGFRLRGLIPPSVK